MEINQDFRDLLKSFNAHEVDYLVIGGYALAFHGAPRYPGDMDLWVNLHADNAKKIIKSLEDFGFGSLGLSEVDFTNRSFDIISGKENGLSTAGVL